MFDRFKFAKKADVEAHVQNMMVGAVAAKNLITEIQVYPDGHKPDLLTDFGTGLFEGMKELTEHLAFRDAMINFHGDLLRITVQIVEDDDMVATVKQLKESKTWLDENLAYMARSRDKQIRLAESLRGKLQITSSSQNDGGDE